MSFIKENRSCLILLILWPGLFRVTILPNLTYVTTVPGMGFPPYEDKSPVLVGTGTYSGHRAPGEFVVRSLYWQDNSVTWLLVSLQLY